MLATFQMNKEYFSTAVASLTPRSNTSNLKDSANVKTPWTLMSSLVKPKDNESVNTSLANCSIQLPYGRSKCPFNNEPWKQSISLVRQSFWSHQSNANDEKSCIQSSTYFFCLPLPKTISHYTRNEPPKSWLLTILSCWTVSNFRKMKIMIFGWELLGEDWCPRSNCTAKTTRNLKCAPALWYFFYKQRT